MPIQVIEEKPYGGRLDLVAPKMFLTTVPKH